MTPALAAIPGTSDAMALTACVALTAAVLIFVFLVEPDPGDAAPHRGHLDQLMERRDTIYDNLRDLRFEYRAGKYSEADFEVMKNAMETEAALVLAEIDQVTEAGVKRPRGPRTAPERGPR